MKDPQTASSYIQCLSVLEEKICQLYQTMADKIDMPLASGILFSIAQDSLKCSILLTSLTSSIGVSEKKIKLCEKKLHKTARVLDSFYVETQVREKISSSDFQRIAENLIVIESSFSEEYLMLTRIDILEPLVKELNEKYDVPIEKVQEIFKIIIADKKQHKILIGTVMTLLEANVLPIPNFAPPVKFQNPDRWNQTLPSTV